MKTIIIGIFLRDGSAVSNYFLRLSDEFAKLGYRVIIIADEDRKNLVDTTSNPMILTWPSYHPTKLKDFIFLKNIIQKYKVEMLISSFNAVNFFVIAGWLLKVPNRVAWIRTMSDQMLEVPKWKFFRKRIIYKLATKIIVNSEATKNDAKKTYKIQEKKIILLPNLIKENDKYISFNKEYKIVFVGRFHKSKGIDVLIKAFSLIIEKFPELKLEIIGGDGNQAEFIKLVKHHGIQSSVNFLGKQPMQTVLEHFATAQFSVVPSLAEAFGIVVIETFSVKTPVIGSDTGGIAKIIEDGKSGLLFPPGDYKALASKMEILLRSQELIDRLAEGAYQRFKHTYSLEDNIEHVAEMFHGLIESNKE
ncbi:glycosyltransferase family 4 protein [Sulfurovum sp. CS9]|uniref:glycosyltransferase family 4 protein n=1 Tax=Sulfurovum sp. CS9 TaxID=3391146 RepID=UPI0039EA10F3